MKKLLAISALVLLSACQKVDVVEQAAEYTNDPENSLHKCGRDYILCRNDGHFYILGQRLFVGHYSTCNILVLGGRDGDAIVGAEGNRICKRVVR